MLKRVDIDYSNFRVDITCKGADTLPLDSLEEGFQSMLKKRSKKDVEQIIQSIVTYGFSFPFFVTIIDGHNLVLDGCGRILALAEMRKRGADLPCFPVSYVSAHDEAEAKQKLLRLNSAYGTMTQSSVIEFMGDIEIDASEISLPGISFGSDMTESEETDGVEYKEKYEIIIQCVDENEMHDFYNEFSQRSIKCRLSTL